MADLKISGMTAATAPDTDDLLEIVEDGNTRKATIAQVLGVGQIPFPASQNASSDANTLDDYEEGTFTPIDVSGASLSFSSASGKYTKIGNTVTYRMYVAYPSTGSGANSAIGGLPFTIGGSLEGRAGASTIHDVAVAVECLQNSGGTDIQPRDGDNVLTNKTNANLSLKQLYIGGHYQV